MISIGPGSTMHVAARLLTFGCAVASMAVAPLLIACSPAPRAQARHQAAAVSGSSPSPLRVCGRALCAGDERFRWRGVTAFGLADLLSRRPRDRRAHFHQMGTGHGVQRAACARDAAQRGLARSLPARTAGGRCHASSRSPGSRGCTSRSSHSRTRTSAVGAIVRSRSCGSRSGRWAACVRRPATVSWSSPTSRITDRRRAWTSPPSCGASSRRSRRSCPWPGARRRTMSPTKWLAGPT